MLTKRIVFKYLKNSDKMEVRSNPKFENFFRNHYTIKIHNACFLKRFKLIPTGWICALINEAAVGSEELLSFTERDVADEDGCLLVSSICSFFTFPTLYHTLNPDSQICSTLI